MSEDPIMVRAFVESCDHEQAAFINRIGRLLYMRCGSDFKNENQLCYIADKLNKDGEAFIKALSEFIVLKHKDID